MHNLRDTNAEKHARAIQEAAPYLSLGAQLAASVLVPGGIGWYIDSRMDSTPWGMVIGLCIGCVVGLVQFLRSANRLLECDHHRKEKKG